MLLAYFLTIDCGMPDRVARVWVEGVAACKGQIGSPFARPAISLAERLHQLMAQSPMLSDNSSICGIGLFYKHSSTSLFLCGAFAVKCVPDSVPFALVEFAGQQHHVLCAVPDGQLSANERNDQ